MSSARPSRTPKSGIVALWDLAAQWPDSRLARWVLAMVILALCLFANVPWNLENYDQAKQAFVGYEIASTGHFFYQHTPRGEIATKPPLAGWLTLPTYFLTGSWDLAWRLPGLLATALLFWLLARSGGDLLPVGGAFLACAAFGINMLTPRLATLVRTDMLLTLFIAACGILILKKISSPTPWRPGENVLFALSMTAALLTKGPVIYAFLLPGMMAYSLLAPTGSRMQIWSAWWSWILPLTAFLAWGVIGLVSNPEFYQQIVVEEFFSRFDQSIKSEERQQPVWFYFPHLFHKLLPWSILLLLLPALSPGVRSWLRQNPRALWITCWAIGGLIAMTLVPSKRVDRIFPVVVPLSLLLVCMVKPVMKTPWVRPACGVAAICGSLLWIGYFAEVIRHGFANQNGSLAAFGREASDRARSHGSGRLALLQGRDEGLVIYTGLLETTSPSKAFRQFEEGEIDALIAPERRLPEGVLFPEPALTSPPQESGEVYHLFLAPERMSSPGGAEKADS